MSIPPDLNAVRWSYHEREEILRRLAASGDEVAFLLLSLRRRIERLEQEAIDLKNPT